MKNSILLLLTCLVLASCTFMIGVKDLGGKYQIDTWNHPYSIDYKEKTGAKGKNHVILYDVVSYAVADSIILASRYNKTGRLQYWLVFKRGCMPEMVSTYGRKNYDGDCVLFDNLLGPLDETEFSSARKQYHIKDELKLEEIK